MDQRVTARHQEAGANAAMRPKLSFRSGGALLILLSCSSSKPSAPHGDSDVGSQGGASTSDTGVASAGDSYVTLGAGGSLGDATPTSTAAGDTGVAGTSGIVGEGNCLSPYVLPGPITLMNESTARAKNGASALNSTCLGIATDGPDRIYRIAVPATGKTKLQVKATPLNKPKADAFDVVLYVAKSCAPAAPHPRCIACKDSRGGGSHESVEYDNDTGTVQELLIVVDGFDDQPGGDYRLDVALTNP
ncbi:MAG TPA: hypothetical protein VIV60_12210 [Polyangiaceae bacterium]